MWKYYNNTISIYPLLACYLFFTACANPRAPNGGPKDVDPPQVVLEESSANMQTNFTGRSFELTFNEWVKLNDVFNQVVVTPPLEHKPDISLKKKTVTFEFDGKEELRKDATYIINFGEAVKDFNVGLSAEDLRFVFSTGDYIDSLSVQGKVVDAFTGKVAEDVIVMLYDNLADSVVRTERPFYFGKTSKNGTFRIDNIRADTFKIFALVDKNFNYLFDMPSEQIAYQEAPFILTDSTKVNIDLELFQEEQALRLVSKRTERYGKVTLSFNKPPGKDLKLSYDSILQRQQIVYEQDSLHLWYQPKDSVDWSLYLEIQQDSVFYDTLKVKAGSPSAFLAKAKLETKTGKEVEEKLNNHNRNNPIPIAFNHPLAILDTNVIVLLEDTTKLRVKPLLEISVDTLGLLKVQYDWVENMPYELLLLPGAVTDWYGLQNDSILLAFTIPPTSIFGNLIINLKGLEPNIPYLVQLYKGEELMNESTVRADSTFTKNYMGYPAAIPPEDPAYELRIIEDKDNNGRWSPGNYSLKTQSEKMYFRKLGELRGNWDIPYDVDLGEVVTPPPPKEEKDKKGKGSLNSKKGRE
ncbi:MAG: hypothetical protein ACI8YQ_002334 [Polaribacter sp.]|jgi:hypothetical protein